MRLTYDSLQDIAHVIETIQELTCDLKKEFFLNLPQYNSKTWFAICHGFTIVGEAIKNLPLSIKQKYPDVGWRKEVSFRNIIVHQYFGIESLIFWEVIHESPLTKLCEAVIKELKSSNADDSILNKKLMESAISLQIAERTNTC